MIMKKNVLILAIESSCDETAAAVLSVEPSPRPSPRGRGSKGTWPKIKTLSSVVKSQIALHSKFGGVVPEVAARAFLEKPCMSEFAAVAADLGLLPKADDVRMVALSDMYTAFLKSTFTSAADI